MTTDVTLVKLIDCINDLELKISNLRETTLRDSPLAHLSAINSNYNDR